MSCVDLITLFTELLVSSLSFVSMKPLYIHSNERVINDYISIKVDIVITKGIIFPFKLLFPIVRLILHFKKRTDNIVHLFMVRRFAHILPNRFAITRLSIQFYV